MEDPFTAGTQAEIQVPGLRKNILKPNCWSKGIHPISYDTNKKGKPRLWVVIWNPNDTHNQAGEKQG